MKEKSQTSRARTKPFSDPIVNNLSPAGKPYEVSEPGGLRLVVGTHTKAWAFRYKSPITGKHRKMTLGKFPALGLSDARKALAAAKEQIALGVDPAEGLLAEKQERLEAPTVEQVIAEYVRRRASKKRSGHEDKRCLEKEAVPRFGHHKIFSIKRADILNLMDDITDRGSPVAASKALQYCRLMFDFAIERGYTESNPCAGIKPSGKAQQRDRVLTDAEIKSLWAGLATFTDAPAVTAILKLCLVTGQRVGEVRRLRWQDIEGDWWTIPSEFSKNKLAHAVYLSDMAVAIIKGQGARGAEYVFPGQAPDVPLDRNTPDRHWRRHRDELGLPGIRIHDFRRTVATRMTEIGVNRLVVSKVLNHAERGVTAIYDRHGYRPEIQEALTAWAVYLSGLLAAKEKSTEQPPAGSIEITSPDLVQAAIEAEYEKHRDSKLQADYFKTLYLCLAFHRPVPGWLAKAAALAFGEFDLGTVETLNEALGRPSNTLRTTGKRKTAFFKFEIRRRIEALIEQHGGQAPDYFDQVQKDLIEEGHSISRPTIENYFSQTRQISKGK